MTDSKHIIYDEETFPNVFTLAAEHADYPLTWAFQISPWRDDSKAIIEWVNWCRANGYSLVGFNNVGFDYPVLHTLLQTGRATARMLYDKAMAIIGSQDDNRFMHNVKPSDRHVTQIDLFKIWHFDNRARSTSLKVLEFNLRMDNLCDLPFPVGTMLNYEQTQVLKTYNAHDVKATKLFYKESIQAIQFRQELSTRYGRDFMNHSDVKIGADIFQHELEKAGVQCYVYGLDGRQPKQTKRERIYLNECIPNYVRFERPEFQRIHKWMRDQIITETKGVFTDVKATINGLEYVFGTGGIHASVENETFVANDEWMVYDIDVAGMYPSIAIANGYYPEHLGKQFVEVYKQIVAERAKYKKGTSENAAYKLAGNGAYGKSNDKFSIFFDPQFTMKVTITGQLSLAMLVENLLNIAGLRIIQSNTDGVTMWVRRADKPRADAICAAWESMTGLVLEYAEYTKFIVADVNSYIGVYADKSKGVKRIGRYEYKMEWHQNHGALVIAKVAEQVLVYGKQLRETLESWPDKFDFMLRVKVTKGSELVTVVDGADMRLEKTQRYYVAKGGTPLFKIMPPLAKKPGVYRRIGVESGWGVCPCNSMVDAVLPVDYSYYEAEIDKLILGVM